MTKWFPRVFGSVTVGLCLLWIVGLLLSDRWAWSQWLAWIPTLFVLLFLFVSVVLFLSTKKHRVAFVFGGVFTITVFWFCFVENRLFSNNKHEGDIKVVGWTMSHSKARSAEESANIITSLNGDITLLTHGWQVRSQQVIRDWIDAGGYRVINSQFTLLTKYTPIQVHTLIASDGIFISMFVLDTTETLGDVLVVWAVDFPSSVVLSKMEIANRIRLLLPKNTLPPNLVIGDFNMTGRSSAIDTIFPDLTDASKTAGSGLMASFPMEFPLYHIDHILVSKDLISVNYELVNPHIGRHRIQIAEIKSN